MRKLQPYHQLIDSLRLAGECYVKLSKVTGNSGNIVGLFDKIEEIKVGVTDEVNEYVKSIDNTTEEKISD